MVARWAFPVLGEIHWSEPALSELSSSQTSADPVGHTKRGYDTLATQSNGLISSNRGSLPFRSLDVDTAWLGRTGASCVAFPSRAQPEPGIRIGPVQWSLYQASPSFGQLGFLLRVYVRFLLVHFWLSPARSLGWSGIDPILYRAAANSADPNRVLPRPAIHF